MKRRWLFALAVIAAGVLAATWWLTRTTRVSPSVASPTTSNLRAAVSAAVVRAALKNPDLRARPSEFGRTFQALLAIDLDAALIALRELPPGSNYDTGLFLLLDAWTKRDAQHALTLANEWVKTRDQAAIYSSLFDRFARGNLPMAQERLALVPAGPSRDFAVRALVSVWTQQDASAALAWARSQTSPVDREAALETVIDEVSRSDPLRALDLALESLTGRPLEWSLLSTLQKLVVADLPAATSIVNRLPLGVVQTQAAAEVAVALARKSAADALTWINTLPEGEAQNMAFAQAIETWGSRDLTAARHYVANMPTGVAQDGAASRLAFLFGSQDPFEMLAWAQSLTGETTRTNAVVQVVSAWARSDPAAAARWAAEQSITSAVSVTALTGALSYWLLQDPAATQAFVRNLSPATQPAAAAAISPSLAQTDPLAALSWAQTLPQPAAREVAISAAFARWLDNAPAAARAWLATANLPPEQKAALAKRSE